MAKKPVRRYSSTAFKANNKRGPNRARLYTPGMPQGQVVAQRASRIMALGNVMPKFFWCDHNYNAIVSLSANGTTGLNGTSYYFRPTSTYAPDYSGAFAPHQPYGYDEMRSFYNQAVVTDFKVTVKILKSATTDASNTRANALILFVKNYTDVADPAGETVTQWEEKPSAHVLYAAEGYGSNYQCWTGSYSVAEVIGATKTEILENDDYSSTGNANPARGLLFGLSCGNPTLDTGATVLASVSIAMRVRWTSQAIKQSS